jgi:hypothetical protein
MTDNIIDNQRLVGNKIKFGSALRMAGYWIISINIYKIYIEFTIIII